MSRGSLRLSVRDRFSCSSRSSGHIDQIDHSEPYGRRPDASPTRTDVEQLLGRLQRPRLLSTITRLHGFYQLQEDVSDDHRCFEESEGFHLIRGLFNVPHVAHSYLINGKSLQRFTPTYIDARFDSDVKFGQSIRNAVRSLDSILAWIWLVRVSVSGLLHVYHQWNELRSLDWSWQFQYLSNSTRIIRSLQQCQGLESTLSPSWLPGGARSQYYHTAGMSLPQ